MLFIFIVVAPYFYTSICAASKFTLSNGKPLSNVLYTNHTYTLKVRNQNVYFYSNHSNIAEISKQTGKLLVKEPGKVTITARRKTTSQIVCKETFTVRRRSDYIVPSYRNLTLVTGQSRAIAIRKSPLSSTDVIRFRSSNPNIITVNSITGRIKAVRAGQASIIIYSMSDSSRTYKDRSNKKVQIPVKVYSSITSAKQISLSEVELSFTDIADKYSNSDFNICNADKNTVHVAGVTVQNNKAVLSLGKSLTDGKVYTISYKGCKCNFTACDGVIRKFEFLATKVPINTETSIVAYSFDKNGIQLGEYEYGRSYPGISFTVSSSHFTSNKKLKFTTSRDTALARIYYKSSANGSISADSGNVTISAYDPELISAQYKCNITNTTDFTFKDDTKINTVLPSNGNNYYAHFSFTTSSNKDVPDYSKYTLTSANTNVLLLQDYTVTNSQKYVGLIPIKQGSTYINLKDSYGYVVASFPVTVSAPSVLSSVSPSKDAIPLVNTASNGNETITITAKDQYGNSLNDSITSGCYLECVSCSSGYVTVSDVNSNPYIYYNCSFPEITFYNTDIAPGTYTYKIYVGDKYTTVSVVVTGLLPSKNP